jgi:hypothetical protein
VDLALLDGDYAVVRLPRDSEVPALPHAPISAIVRDRDALTFVAPEAEVPPGADASTGWRALEVAGPLDLALTGVLASLAEPLRDAGVPIFVVSSHATDFVLVPAARLDDAVAALEAAGHNLKRGQAP